MSDLPFDPSDSSDDVPPAAVVAFPHPLPLQVFPIEHDLAPEGVTCMEVRVEGRRVSRYGVATSDVEREKRLFQSPVLLFMSAEEADPGIRAQLVAVIPRKVVHEIEAEEEPWKASLDSPPDYDEPREDEAIPGIPHSIGVVVRLAAERKFPDDLGKEAIHLFQSILRGEGENVVDRLLRGM